MLRLLSLTILLSLNQAVGADLALDGTQSQVSYSVTKYGSIEVVGELDQSFRASLKGTLSVESFQNLVGLDGWISLTKPRFETDSFRRDEAVTEVLGDEVKVIVQGVKNYNQNSGEMLVNLRVHINGVVSEHQSNALLSRTENGVKVSGEMLIDRAFHKLNFTGVLAMFDPAIAEQVSVSYSMVFTPSADLSVVHSMVPKINADRGDQPMAPGLWERIQAFFD